MSTPPIWIAFFLFVGLFAGWVAFLLREEQAWREQWDQALVDDLSELRDARAPRAETPAEHRGIAVVRSGSFCRVPGAVASNAHGEAMVCSSTEGNRPRWRRAPALSETA